MPGVVYGATFPLGLSGEVDDFTPSKFGWDYAIDGIPFISAISDERPYQRGFVEISKQQIDTSSEAGEQTLDNGIWLRSQSMFTGGAGREIFESTTDQGARTEFLRSAGVNPWGESVELLNDTELVVASGAGQANVVTSADGEVVYVNAAGTVTRVTASSTSTITGWAATPSWVEAAGSVILGCHSLGIDQATAGTATPLWTQGAGTVPKAWWVKQRIIASSGAELHELTLTGGDLDAATPIYTHPISTWTWTSAVETPDAILVSGYSGSQSAIYKIVLDSDGGLPTLAGATTTAELPRGEVVHSMFVYLGSYIALGTNRGIRIGQVGSGGLISYGPLSVETDNPVYGLSADDRFIYGTYTNAIDGMSGLVRVDLSVQDSQGRNAWASDLSAGAAGTVYGVAPLGGTSKMAFAVDGQGLFLMSDDKVATGYLETSQVRFSTLQPKHFLYVTVRTPAALGGALTVSTLEADGDYSSLLVIPEGDSSSEKIGLARRTDGETGLGLRFDLARGAVTTAGATLDGWQLEAIPAAVRNEELRFAVQCSDSVKDRSGNKYGSPGYGYLAYSTLRDAVVSGQRVRFQDFATGELLVVTVSDIRFQSTTPRGRDAESRFGGFIYVTLRTV